MKYKVAPSLIGVVMVDTKAKGGKPYQHKLFVP